MPLKGDGRPARSHPLGVVFDMLSHFGTVRCHVMRSAVDHLGDGQARGGVEVVSRFERNRVMFEAVASDLHDSGHRSPWIMVEHVIGPPPSAE